MQKPKRAERKKPETIDRNLDLIARLREKHKAQLSPPEKLAEKIGEFFSSIASVYVHVAILVVWLLINTGLLVVTPVFDPPPFTYLSTFACVEAIFLTIFVLIRQNRMMNASEKRAELDLQVSLLTEEELTRLVRLNALIAKKLGIDAESEIKDLKEAEQKLDPEDVVRKMEKTIDIEH